MANRLQNQYQPDLVSPPGETLAEVLEQLGMTQADLAERTGRPKKTISEIVTGKAAIAPETALQLERVLGISANFWNARNATTANSLPGRRNPGSSKSNCTGWMRSPPNR